MAEIFVRPSRQKLDPRDPKSDPNYKQALKAGEKRAPDMKFESEGERRDYERAVKSNPHNVYGLGSYFPPLRIRSFVSFRREISEAEREQIALDRFKENSIKTIPLFCTVCNALTDHQGTRSRLFCQTCAHTFTTPQGELQ